jgi:hypothetical protein
VEESTLMEHKASHCTSKKIGTQVMEHFKEPILKRLSLAKCWNI